MTRRREARDDLLASAEAAARDAERIVELEREKVKLDPEDPRMESLSDESAAVSERLVLTTKAELQISKELGQPSE